MKRLFLLLFPIAHYPYAAYALIFGAVLTVIRDYANLNALSVNLLLIFAIQLGLGHILRHSQLHLK